MGFLNLNPKQAVKNKAASIADKATHATCFSCGHHDLKHHFKKIGGFGDDRVICRNQKAHDKRRAAMVEGNVRITRKLKKQLRSEGTGLE